MLEELGVEYKMQKNGKIESKIQTLLNEIESLGLTPKEKMYLVWRILDEEFKLPRTQKEIEQRKNSLITTLDLIFEEHFEPMTVLEIIAKLGSQLLKKHPELKELEDIDYIG